MITLLSIQQLRQRYFEGFEGQRSPVFHAIDADQPVAVGILFPENNIDQTNGSGFTPLLTAALFCGSSACLSILLKNGASVAAMCENGFSALHIAALRGKADYIDLLARIGAPLEIKDGEGRTPIMLATFYGVFEAVEALTKHGSDVSHLYHDGSTPLHEAVRQKRLDVVTVLLRALPDLRSRSDGKTPVELALSLGYHDIYDTLMSYRVEKALQTAVLNDVTDAIPGIFGFNPRVKDENGVALCMAVFKRSEIWVKALLNHNSDASSYADNARIGCVNWLTYAIRGATPSARIVRLIIDAGASTESPILCQWGRQTPVACTPVQCMKTAVATTSKKEGVDEAHLFQLKRILRLFEQASAVHATSWLWSCTTNNAPTITDEKVWEKSSAIVSMLPLLRGRGKKRTVLSAVWR